VHITPGPYYTWSILHLIHITPSPYYTWSILHLVHITNVHIRVDKPGPYYKRALKVANELNFQGISLHTENNKANPQINYGQFYRSLQKSIEKRLMSDRDEKLANDTKVLFCTNWTQNVCTYLTYGEAAIRRLFSRLQVDERKSLRGFREYLTKGSEVCQVPPAVASPQNTAKLIPISSSKTERRFSQTNLSLGLASLATTTFVFAVYSSSWTSSASLIQQTTLLHG